MDIATIILVITYISIIIATIILSIKAEKKANELFKKEIKIIETQEKINWILLESDLTKENPAVTKKKIKEVINSRQTK